MGILKLGDVTITVDVPRLKPHNYDYRIDPPIGLAEVIEHAHTQYPDLEYCDASIGGGDIDCLGVFALNIDTKSRLLVWVVKPKEE